MAALGEAKLCYGLNKLGLFVLGQASSVEATNADPEEVFSFFFFFSIWVFFHAQSPFTGQQGKGEGIFLTTLRHFHPLHRQLDISGAITAESSPLQIACSRTLTGNLWFPSASG